MEFCGNFANVADTVGGIVAAYGVVVLLMAKRHQEEDIAVILQLELEEGREVILPLHLKRRDLSRAEVLGRMGMLPMRQKGARFALRHLSTPVFLQELNEVLSNQRDTIFIPVSDEEIDQFDL